MRQRAMVRLPDLLFVILVVTLSLTGLVSYAKASGIYYRSNLLPANALFDLFIVAYVFVAPTTRLTLAALFVLVISSLYLLLSLLFLPPSIGGAPSPTDVILAFKPFIYLIILAFSRPRGASISMDTLEKIFKFLLVAFLIKYLAAKALFGIPRPGLFTENNFELAFLLVLFIFLSRRDRLGSQLWVVLLIAVVLVSGSRSGLLGLVAALMTSARQGAMRVVIAATVVPVFLIAVLSFADTRLAGLSDLTQVDRFIFLTLFLEELQRFNAWNYFVGWGPMTPLTNITCTRLDFYTVLLSSSNSNVCYPVILHVFYFRAILDHGFLGLMFLIAGVYIMLRSNGNSPSLAFAILLQGLINSLSVSGFSNTYFVLAVVLVTSNYASQQSPPKEAPA